MGLLRLRQVKLPGATRTEKMGGVVVDSTKGKARSCSEQDEFRLSLVINSTRQETLTAAGTILRNGLGPMHTMHELEVVLAACSAISSQLFPVPEIPVDTLMTSSLDRALPATLALIAVECWLDGGMSNLGSVRSPDDALVVLGNGHIPTRIVG